MSEEEAFAELKKYIEEKLDNGESLNKIAADMGVNYSAGFEDGIRDGIPGVEEAVKALGAAAEATLRIKLDTHSPSKLTEKIGGYFDAGMEIGVVKGIPGIEAVTAQLADAAVASTLSIMNAQGADSVGAYSPVYKEVYNTSPVYNSQTVSTPSTSQPAPAPSFSIYIGDEEIRQFVVDTIADENANSGGWSI
ncbi:MAG: hypothetical protein ACI4JN_10015 [Ruminococcus sp.]